MSSSTRRDALPIKNKKADNPTNYTAVKVFVLPVPVAARSKAWVCGRSPAEIVISNPTEGMDICLS